MAKLNNSSNAYSASNFQVSTVAGNGNYQSIQDAINAAVALTPSSSNPFLIWIQAGTYTENLTLAPYVNLSGGSDPSTGTGVVIVGNAVYPDPSMGNLSLTNVGFSTPNGSAAISFQSTSTSLCHLQSVDIDAGTGIGLECTGSGMTLQFSIGSISAASGGICKNITNGFIEFFSGLVNFTDTASTISGGTLRILSGDISDSFDVTGGLLEIFNSIIQSGSFTCITLGAATNCLVSNTSMGTSGTYIITGTGNLVYTDILPLQSGTPIDPGITLSPLPTLTGGLSFDGGTQDVKFSGPYSFNGTLTGNTAVTFPTSAAPAASTLSEWDAHSNLSANSMISGYATTATAASTTTLTVSSKQQQYFTGSTTQTVLLPVTSTLVLGQSYTIVNNSTGVVTVQSSGANTIQAMAADTQLVVTCILTSGTTAASWSWNYITATGEGTVTSIAMTVPSVLSISGSPITTSGTLAVSYSGTALPIANGGTSVTSVTTSPTATAFAGWDAHSNLSANNMISGYATTATAAGTTTLTVSSAQQQYFTGSTTQTVVMPVTSTLVLGQVYIIANNSSGVVTVQSSGANTIQAMAANTMLTLTVINTAVTTAAGWSAEYSLAAPLTLPLSLANGGTNASLTASNGGIFYSSGTAGAILSGTATANQMLMSGASSAPGWSTSTYPLTNAANTLLYASAANTMAALATGNNGLLVTSASGVPSILADGTTGQVLLATTGSPPSWGAVPSSFSPNSTVQIADDFIGVQAQTQGGNFSMSSVISWNSPGSSWNTAATTDIAHPGIISSNSLGNGGNMSMAASCVNNNAILLGGGAITLNFVFNIVNLSTGTNRYILDIGLSDTVFSSTIANGVYFVYSDNLNSGDWQIVCTASSTSTTTNSATAVTTGWHNAQITINAAASSVSFTMDGTSLGTITTHIPTTHAVSPYINVAQSAGTIAAGTLEVDLFYFTQTLTTAR